MKNDRQGVNASKIELDQLDDRLIELLMQDGRASHAVLAKTLEVSEGTIRNRLRRLLDEGFIQIVAYPNPNRIDTYFRAFVSFKVEAQKLKAVAHELTCSSYIRYAAISTGSYEIVALTEFPSRQEMLQFMTEIVGNIDGIRETQSFVLLAIIKSLGSILYPLDDGKVEGET